MHGPGCNFNRTTRAIARLDGLSSCTPKLSKSGLVRRIVTLSLQVVVGRTDDGMALNVYKTSMTRLAPESQLSLLDLEIALSATRRGGRDEDKQRFTELAVEKSKH